MQLLYSSLLLIVIYIVFSYITNLNRYWISFSIQVWACWVLLYLVYYVFNYGANRLVANPQTINILTQPNMIDPFYQLQTGLINPFFGLQTYRDGIDCNFQPMTTLVTIQRHLDHVIRIPLEDQVDLDLDDNHNVHNKTIKRTAVMAITNLQKSDQGKYSIESAITELLTFVDTDAVQDLELKASTIDMAKRVIRQIDGMNCLYVTANIRERELFRLIWERINHPINEKIQNQLKENLIKELADCNRAVAGGQKLSLHCCEGRVTRLLQSLQECDSEQIVNLRPMWAFKEEIENMITKYRQKLLKKSPEIYRQIENKMELNDDDRKDINKFNSCLISNLQKRFQTDYIRPGYLTPIELNDLTRTYYESLYDY